VAELDDDLEDQDDEQPTGFAALPVETQRELKKLRKENQQLRSERGTLQGEVLAVKFGQDVAELIPEEIASYEKKVEFAEKLQARFALAANTETPAPEAPAEAPTEEQVPEGLKAIQGAPPATAGLPDSNTNLTAKELAELHQKDPQAAFRAAESKYRAS
jgi:hypothetical protein